MGGHFEQHGRGHDSRRGWQLAIQADESSGGNISAIAASHRIGYTGRRTRLTTNWPFCPCRIGIFQRCFRLWADTMVMLSALQHWLTAFSLMDTKAWFTRARQWQAPQLQGCKQPMASARKEQQPFRSTKSWIPSFCCKPIAANLRRFGSARC